jgi:asparagine synthase (glutamine-hydrolysing)
VCGIVGLFDSNLSDAPPLIAKMLAQIAHRGPDSFGMAQGDGWALGTARLAIIDLEGGSQPMQSVDERFCIAFNGEIFNYVELRQDLLELGYRFRTSSDTEVLLNALIEWGLTAMPRLEGQFAFAFIDKTTRRLLLGRDRFGERPLYYFQRDRRVALASEIKGLFSLDDIPRALDPGRIAETYLLWAPLPNATAFTGIRSLPPAHCAEISDDGLNVFAWAHPTVPGQAFSGTFDEACGEVRRLLTASVKRRLRSDVEVGCYLSGGLDSAIVGQLAREVMGDKLRTFSVTFDDPNLDESAWQDLTAEHLGTRHEAVRIKRGDVASIFPEVVFHCEAPLFRAAPAPMYLLAKAVREAGIKVVLTGEGADEAFLGYGVFREALFRRDFMTFFDDDSRIAELARLHPYLTHFHERNARTLLGFYREHLAEEVPGLFSHEPRFALGRFALRLLGGRTPSRANASRRLSEWMNAVHPGFRDASMLERARALEYVSLLGGYLLASQGDRMTSAHGVEGRYPFTDHNVVELALAIPTDALLREGVEKAVLRSAFRDALPSSVARRPKNPYRSADASAFLHGPRLEWLEELLRPQSLAGSNILEPNLSLRFIERLKGLPPDAISPREDQAFVLLVSTLLLETQFVRHFAAIDPSSIIRQLAS